MDLKTYGVQTCEAQLGMRGEEKGRESINDGGIIVDVIRCRVRENIVDNSLYTQRKHITSRKRNDSDAPDDGAIRRGRGASDQAVATQGLGRCSMDHRDASERSGRCAVRSRMERKRMDGACAYGRTRQDRTEHGSRLEQRMEKREDVYATLFEPQQS